MASDDEQRDADLALLGARLRALREARGWTLEELAERSGLSKPFLSRLETSSRQPSIAAVLTLAKAFEVSVGALFDARPEDEACVIVRGDRAPLRTRNGIAFATLSAGSAFNLQPMYAVISPSREGTERYQHDGEEWLYVLSGRLRLSVGEKQHELEPGQAAHFNSRLPHRLDALDGKEARIVLVACSIPVTLNSRRETAGFAAGLVG